MKTNKEKAYKGYKKAHIYTMIGSIALGLCLIIATIIIVCFFSVEVKVETPTTVIAQTTTDATNNATTDATNNATTDATNNATTDATNNATANANTDTTVNAKENKPVEEETNTSIPAEDTVEISTENPVEESAENKYSTLIITVNIYTNICQTKFVEITMPVGTTLTLAQIKELVLNEFPTFNYARTVGVPASYTFTEEDNGLPGIIKISTITVETPEEDNTIIPEPTEAESEELAEPEAEATETEKGNQEVVPAEPEEPAQAPTETAEEPEAEPAEEPVEIIADTNNTSILTVTVNIYTNICKTVFVNIEKSVGTIMTRQEIKDYILSLYTGFTRVRATGTPESFTFVEEDGKFPGIIKID